MDGRSFAEHKGNGTPVYLLAHEELHAVALDMLGPRRIEQYRDILLKWADSYRARRWPEDTPDYLLTSYPRMLYQSADVARLVDCVTDVARHDRMRRRFGEDTAAIEEVNTALEAVATSGNGVLVKRLVARQAALRRRTFLRRLRSALRRPRWG